MPTTQRDDGLRAALYLRMSLDRTGEGAGIDRQRQACASLADARGWRVVREYVDNSVSASKGVRPAWTELLADARAGRVDVVVSWALDRLVRRASDLERLVETGVRAATVQGDLDLTTVQGELIGGILANVARAEVRQKGERQRAANLQRAQRGDVGWTRRPFGYDRTDGSVVVVEAEAEALKVAAESVLSGGTLAAAARAIDAKGLTTTAGKPWNVTSLRRALLNPRYAGRAVSKGADHGQGAWPVILPTDVQERLSEVLRDPARRTQHGTKVKYLLTGLLNCGRCGERMYASPMGTGSRRWMTYRCQTTHLTRHLDSVDEVVTGVILERLKRPDAADLFNPDDDLDSLRAEAVDLRQRRDDLAELLAEGLLSPAKVREQSTVLGNRLRDVEARLSAAAGGDPVAALAGAVDVSAVWQALPLSQRRGVVEALVDVTILPSGKGVRFDPEQVQIEWRVTR